MMYSHGVRIIIWVCAIVYLLQHIYFPAVDQIFGLAYIGHHNFRIPQLVTYGLLHGDMYHIFVNMFMLAVFGSRLESALGMRNFLLLFLISVVGGGVCQTITNMITINGETGMYFPEDTTLTPLGQIQFAMEHGATAASTFRSLTIGASAGVFGCMVAFTCLFPRQRLSLFLLPVSVSARFLIIFYLILEVYNGVMVSGTHIAHFAHLGGALFGFLMIRYWKKTLFL